MKIDASAERPAGTAAWIVLVLIAVALISPIHAAAVNPEQQELVARTVSGHEKNLTRQKERLKEADALRAKGEYRKALAIIDQVRLDCSAGRTHCTDQQAVRYAAVRDEANAAKSTIGGEYARSLLQSARKLASERKYEEAITRADEAGKIDPALASKVGDFKTYCQAKIKDRDFSTAVKVETFQPQYQSSAEQIDRLYREATVLFDKGRYTETIKKLEEIYVLDPLNNRATHLLELTYRKVYTAMSQRQIAEARGIAAHGNWVWVEPQLPTGPSVQRQAEVKVEGNEVQRRMDDIILPEVELADGTDISSALNYLRQQARAFDPQKNSDNGIVFMYSDGGESAAEESAGKKNTAGKDAADDEKDDGAGENSVKISEMKFTNISLSDALRYICLETGMRYRIDGNTVVVGRNIEVTRDASFSVPRALINGILGNDAGSSAESTGDTAKASKSDAFGSSDGGETGKEATASGDSAKLISYFSKRGVGFGSNAKITYNARTGKLLVTNTPDNLRRLDELLRQLSVIATPMVMTEIKVIQIREGDFEELSFYWAFAIDHNDASVSIDTNKIIRQSTEVLQPFSGKSTSLISNLSIFPGIIDSASTNLSISVNALSQHSNTETIQAPRLVSESGREAWIKMVTKTRFPDSWDAPSIETNGDATTVQMPLPELGEYTEYGTKLNVTPKVMADNYTIELSLYTEIKDVLKGPAEQGKSGAESNDLENVYGVEIDRGYIDDAGDRHSYSDYPQYYWVWLPEFITHSLEVKLKVYDGQTVVMGGVTSSKTYRMEDRTPLLSDIPLLGRLFTAKAESNDKATLLFFVTARLVDSYGRPLNNTADDRGIPRFNW